MVTSKAVSISVLVITNESVISEDFLFSIWAFSEPNLGERVFVNSYQKLVAEGMKNYVSCWTNKCYGRWESEVEYRKVQKGWQCIIEFSSVFLGNLF